MPKTVAAAGVQNSSPAPVGGLLPLAMISAGNTVQVQAIRGRGDTRHFLEGLGFVEGGQVTVVTEVGGNLIVEAKGARIALDRQLALKVMVA